MSGYESRRRSQDTDRSAAEWFYRNRRRKRGRLAPAEGRLSLDKIASRDRLYQCFMLLKEEGGQAPGPDNIRYVDLSPKEVGRLAGDYSRLILEGAYRPQGVRPCPIPKPGSEEKRVLEIGSIFDRVVAKALSTALEPYWERVFVDNSWGFRPGRGTWGMLAESEVTMAAEDRWVIAIDDVKRAFDNIRVEDVLDAHRRLFERDDVVALGPAEQSRILGFIAAVTQGPRPNRQTGISQGNPFSPLAMNAVLHYGHDVLLDNSEHPPWARYADNVCYLAKGVREGQQALNHARRLLRSRHLELKGEDGVRDLSVGHRAQLLGFNLRKEGDGLEYEIGNNAYSQLEEHLKEAHEHPDPPAVAKASVRGWIDSLGPTFEEGGDAVSRALHTAAQYGFREIGSVEELRGLWEASCQRWRKTRRAATKARRR